MPDQTMTPTETDFSDDAMRIRVREDMSRSKRAYGPWEREAKEDYRFTLGEQWTEEEKSILAEQNRPALVINKIGVQIDVLSGYERNNSGRIRVSPEGSEDKVFSEIGDKALAYVDKVSQLSYKLSHQFDDGLITGKGVIEMVLDYDQDPLYGDLIFRVLEPYSVLVDPDSREYDLSDAEFVGKIVRYSKAKLKSLYPEKKALIDELGPAKGDEWIAEGSFQTEGDADNYGNNPRGRQGYHYATEDDEGPPMEDKKYTLIEYWYRRYVPRWFLYDIATRRVSRFSTEDEANERIQALMGVYGAIGPEGEAVDQESLDVLLDMKPIKRTVPEMWVCALLAGEIMAHHKSNLEPRYNGYPFFLFRSYWRPSAPSKRLECQGLPRRAKDPQREVNKARSQYLHVLNTSANSGWVGDDDALPPNKWVELEQFGARPGIVIRKKPGSDLQRITPTPPDVAQQVRERVSTDNMKEVTGLNPDLLAMEDKTVSGKALAIRIKQALTIVAGVFDNWRLTKKLLGRAIFKLLPDIMDANRLERVVGQAFLESNQMSTGALAAILSMIEDGRYDVDISDATDSPTMRAETFEQLLEIAEKLKMPLPPDLLIEWSNIPNSNEVIDRIQEFQQQQLAAAQQQGQGAPA
jgi:hypothetical protein